MKHAIRLVFAAAMALVAFANGLAFAAFTDPKPPAVVPLPAAAPAEAKKNPDATFHAAPKPLSPAAKVTDWPCFLGPNHNLVVPETNLLDTFPAGGPKPVWEMKKGSGYAAPAIVDGRLVLFHRVDDREIVDCLRADTGERFWRYEYRTEYTDRYGYSDGPRASPSIANGCVYTLGTEGKLHCLELSTGRVKWARDIRTEFKLRPGFFGIGSTPLVEGDKLIINTGAVPNGPCVVAFDLATGKALWGAGDAWGMSYASPIAATIHGKRRVFVFAGGETFAREKVTGGLLCTDPENGKVDFTFPWRGTRRESVNASTPLVMGNRVYLAECYGAGGVMLEVTPEFKPKEIWRDTALSTHFMTAVLKDGHLYGVDGHGPADAFLVCVNAETGKEQWRTQPEWKEPIDDRNLTMGTYRAHLMEVDGKTLMLGEYGHLLWVDLTPKGYVEKQRAALFIAEQTWTPPVVSHGLLYVNQNERDVRSKKEARVVCYDLRR